MKGWYNESYRHSLAAHGIRTRGIMVPGNLPIIDATVQKLIDEDRWDLSIEKGLYENYYNIIMRSRLIPGVSYTNTGLKGNTVKAVDFNIAYIEEIDDEYGGYLKPVLKPESGYSDKILASEDGNFYRGVSWEEFQFILNNGFIRSDCSYNLGEAQMGCTYFSEDPTTAASYGGTFQPYHMRPTFDKPGFVVKIKQQPETRIDRKVSLGTNEIAVVGDVPISEIMEIYEIRPYAIGEGYVEIYQRYIPGKGEVYVEGSRSTPSVHVGYKKLNLGDIL